MPQLRDTEEGPPRTDGVVPLRGKRQSRSGGASYLNQIKVISTNSGTRMQTDQIM